MEIIYVTTYVEVVKLFIEAGLIVLTAFISPFRTDRNKIRQLIGTNLIENNRLTPPN
jgi:adenylylsulfate kinase-like enzyme